MKNILKTTMLVAAVLLMGAAQAATTQVSQTKFAGGMISNKWNVTSDQALAWLEHNKMTWNDNGKLGNVSWFDFWSSEIKAKTALSNKAYVYCHVSGAETRKIGDNCETYWYAYSKSLKNE